jgi:hypothetical protein
LVVATELKSGTSYIQLEYEYAVELGKPLFAIVIDEDTLEAKIKAVGRAAIEQHHPDRLSTFRETVLSKTCAFFKDASGIEIAVYRKLNELAQRNDLGGWIRAADNGGAEKLASELAAALEENRKLRARLSDLEKAASVQASGDAPLELPSDLNDDDIVALLRSAVRQMPESKRYSIIFFQHIDQALKLPSGAAKRLLQKAVGDLYNAESVTDKTITFARPSQRAYVAGRRDRGL